MSHLTLILGGARSGKSYYAEQLAARVGGDRVLYVATAEAGDQEMSDRIARHREQRPASWRTLEAPLELGKTLLEAESDDLVILVDCITLLASNIVMSAEDETEMVAEQRMQEELEALLHAIHELRRPCLIVSNEVGMGLVPPYPLGRIYRDILGRANQSLAAAADNVILLVAGIPMAIKGTLPDES